MDKKVLFDKRMKELSNNTFTNATQEKTAGVQTPAVDNDIAELIKFASADMKHSFNKQASRNAIDVFGDIVMMIKAKVGVGEDRAREIASDVVRKASALSAKHGLSISDVSSRIIDKMEHMGGPSDIPYDKGISSFRKEHGALTKSVYTRLVNDMCVSTLEAPKYTKLVVDFAENLKVEYRHKTKEEIAAAILKVVEGLGDSSAIASMKGSPIINDAVRMELNTHA